MLKCSYIINRNMLHLNIKDISKGISKDTLYDISEYDKDKYSNGLAYNCRVTYNFMQMSDHCSPYTLPRIFDKIMLPYGFSKCFWPRHFNEGVLDFDYEIMQKVQELNYYSRISIERKLSNTDNRDPKSKLMSLGGNII